MSHVTVRRIVMPDVKEHVRDCHVTDTFNWTLLQGEPRHRQLTAAEFNVTAAGKDNLRDSLCFFFQY